MGDEGWLEDNTQAIIKYINETTSIKHVFFTFKSGDWLAQKLLEIQDGIRNNLNSCSIFTPIGNGFRKNLPIPFNERAWSIAHCWVWNGMNHEVPVNKENYGHLDHEWLTRCGVNIHQF
jgi:hypothetical protein